MWKKWFHLAKNAAASNLGQLRSPYKLTYVVTKECHSRCQNCAIWKVRPEDELTLDEVRRFAEKNPYWSWVDFTGGEPTDRPDLVELIGAFIEHCPDLLLVHFPTNGLKPKRVREVCQRLLQYSTIKLVVSVSIDGPPELNDKLRGIPGDFKRAIETYQQLRAMPGLRVFVGMTLCSQNVGTVESLVSVIRERVPEFTFRDLHVNLPHLSPHFYQNTDTGLALSMDMAKAMEGVIRQRGLPRRPFELVERIYQRKVRRYIDTGECPDDCAALLSSCYLAENGMVYPCSIWDAPLGNIRDTDYALAPLLSSVKACELRQLLLKKGCPNCWTPCEAYQTVFANLRHVFRC